LRTSFAGKKIDGNCDFGVKLAEQLAEQTGEGKEQPVLKQPLLPGIGQK